jgi:hypothetical protein
MEWLSNGFLECKIRRSPYFDAAVIALGYLNPMLEGLFTSVAKYLRAGSNVTPLT